MAKHRVSRLVNARAIAKNKHVPPWFFSQTCQIEIQGQTVIQAYTFLSTRAQMSFCTIYASLSLCIARRWHLIKYETLEAVLLLLATPNRHHTIVSNSKSAL